MTIRIAGSPTRLVLLDIEGTTTPIAFVYGVLFPYVRTRLPEWVRRNHHLPHTAAVAAQLVAEHAEDLRRNERVPPWEANGAAGESLAAYALWLMDQDRKSPGLKRLQALIMDDGYRAGDLSGEVYPDVPRALRRWSDAGVEAAIYSSGDEMAQRRLFASTEYGDLTHFLSGFFDTAVGAKGDAASYRRIADALGNAPAEILFVSDVAGELDAAGEAGCQVALSLRPGNPPQVGAERFEAITTFDEIE